MITVLFVAVVIEGLFRTIFYPEYKTLQNELFVRHPVYEYFNRPNLTMRRSKPMNYDTVVHTNSMGFRGLESDLEKELVGLWVGGDSNTFAAGVEDNETYVYRLRDFGYMAANISSNGHNLPRQTLLLRDLAAKGLKPRAVVIGITQYQGVANFTGWEYALKAPLRRTTVGPSKQASNVLKQKIRELERVLSPSFQNVRALLIVNSAFYGWIRVGMMNVPAIYNWTKEMGLRADLNKVISTNLDFLRTLDKDNPAARRISSTADYTKAMQSLVADLWGVPFGIILFPAYHQSYPERFPLKGSGLDPMRPMTALVKALKERRVPVLNTLPALKAANIEPLTFPDDGHLNAKSHLALANIVAKWLEKDLGIKP